MRLVLTLEHGMCLLVSLSLRFQFNLYHYTKNHLTRGKSAKCFYQCLVLVGGGFLDAAQDLSQPYGVREAPSVVIYYMI
jgi:hypothetical protein